MTWFRSLTGIEEGSPQQVRNQLSIDGDCLVCPNEKRVAFGRLETPRLSKMREIVADLELAPRGSTIRELVADVRALHADPTNADAMFQVASQFNLLEMADPSVVPERGVGIYENDHTQGPACAIACGGGTIYRNYFADLDGQIGQTAGKQFDCSADLGHQLGNAESRLWRMQNGYLLPTNDGLDEVSTKLQLMTTDELDRLRGRLRIGIQWEVDVTLPGAQHKVSQAYCSALPVAYGRQPEENWSDFAQLILDAAYEATFAAAVINAARTGIDKLFITMLGGGVFGNDDAWIMAAIKRAYTNYCRYGLDVRIVSYGQSNLAVDELVHQLMST